MELNETIDTLLVEDRVLDVAKMLIREHKFTLNQAKEFIADRRSLLIEKGLIDITPPTSEEVFLLVQKKVESLAEETNQKVVLVGCEWDSDDFHTYLRVCAYTRDESTSKLKEHHVINVRHMPSTRLRVVAGQLYYDDLLQMAETLRTTLADRLPPVDFCLSSENFDEYTSCKPDQV